MKLVEAVLLALMLAHLSTAAQAFMDNVPAQGLPSAGVYGSSLLGEESGVVSWRTLAKVETVVDKGKVNYRFDPKISELDRTHVLIRGFMLPMDLGDMQHHFLISAVPPHCPFCLPAGPDAIMEVKAKDAVPFSLEPVLMAGRFVLVKDDAYGLLYQLVDAGPVKSK